MYIYKITDTRNGLIYIGQHNGSKKHYMGSGKIIQRIKKKHPVDYKTFLKKEIIEYCNDIDDLNNAEIFWIAYYGMPNQKIGNNLSIGGLGKVGIKCTEEMKQKLSKNNPKYWKGKHLSKEHKQKISVSQKGKHMSKETKQKLSEINKGKVLSKEHKLKIGKSNLGKHLSNEAKLKMSVAKKGKKLSKEHKKNIKNARLGKEFIKININELRTLYLFENYTVVKLSKYFKCSVSTIEKRLRNNNIKKLNKI